MSSSTYLRQLMSWFKATQLELSGQVSYEIQSRQPASNSYDSMGSEPNELYFAFAWFLRGTEASRMGSVASYKASTQQFVSDDGAERVDECVLVPTADFETCYGDLAFSGTYQREENAHGKVTLDALLLKVDHTRTDDMAAFLQKASRDYMAFQEMITSGQKIFTLSCYPNSTDLHWQDKTFHSATSLDNIVLNENFQEDLGRDVDAFLASKELYDKFGKIWKRGYLFYGPRGTGKTSMVKAIASRTHYDVYNVKLSRFSSDVNMERLLHDIPSKCIVLFEDVDCMGSVAHKRVSSSATGSSCEGWGEIIDSEAASAQPAEATPITEGQKPTLATLLNFLDGISSPEGILVIMTTNHVDKLDPALLRDGRIDLRVHLDKCTRTQVRDLARRLVDVELSEDELIDVPDRVLSPATVSRVLTDLAFQQVKGTPLPKEDLRALVIRRLMAELSERIGVSH